ncbi:hypothetical protein GQ44DRAFT_767116 [Phaeosphaeriaceae sp. PMI808]|nr:hypothetical protein GQ44DRAFT_767116 [Phaeosphaeriaceae sp. PMI808]
MSTEMNQLDQQVDTRLSYRVGWPTLPVLPVESKTDRTLVSKETLSKIKEILQSREVPYFAVDIGYRFNHGQEPQPTVTVPVQYYNPVTGNSSWIEAVKAIRRYMISINNNMAIEIIDWFAYRGRFTQPIDSNDDTTTDNWKSFFPILQTHIQRHQWITLDVINRGLKVDKCSPTIVITARDANSESWWSDTLPLLREKAPPGLEIELLVGDTIFTSDWVGTTSSYDKFTVPMGSSCGFTGAKDCGTLGGQVALGNKSLPFGLSNHHVLGRNLAKHESTEPEKGLHISVVSPSDQDHECFQKGLRESASNLLKRIKRYEKDITKSRLTAACKLQLEEVKKVQSATEPFNRNFGKIYASSGFRSAVYDEDTGRLKDADGKQLEWALDWCLVAIEAHKDAQGSPTQLYRGIEDCVTGVTSQIMLDPAVAVTNYRRLNGATGIKVAKKGRTTNWTTGNISKIASVINGEVFGNYKGPVLCYAIASTRKTYNFLEPGDSGSLVFLNQATESPEIVGLGFASNDSSMVSYMTPMHVVVKDIKQVTKQAVQLPCLAGDVEAVST